MTPSKIEIRPVKCYAVIDRDSDNKIVHLCKFKKDAQVLAENIYLHEEFKGSSVIELLEVGHDYEYLKEENFRLREAILDLEGALNRAKKSLSPSKDKV